MAVYLSYYVDLLLYIDINLHIFTFRRVAMVYSLTPPVILWNKIEFQHTRNMQAL